MPKYIIEREIPNASQLSTTDLQQISQKSRIGMMPFWHHHNTIWI
jgi:hypothetical protein